MSVHVVKKLHLSLQYTVSIFHQLTENLIEAGILMISQHYVPLACAVTVGQIRQFEQLFVYELPWQRSSKNVREPFSRHNWAPSLPPLLPPQHLWADKTHCC